MANNNIYHDIAARTGGDIYIGVVGPVRTGKSTFIKRFMDMLVLPNIAQEYQKERANDELPQSAAGRTIMTTEPKFIPENAVKISLDGNANMSVRLIDCVGYVVPSALGYVEGEQPRMVATPWFNEPIAFDKAAEIGTRKVINEHSTIGLVITTDGSISDIPREEYAYAEERVINELKEINKPFVTLLNCMYPDSDESVNLAADLSYKYQVPVIPINCIDMDENDIRQILARILFEFPVSEISIMMPTWVNSLDADHWLRKEITEIARESSADIEHIRDIKKLEKALLESSNVENATIAEVDLGCGNAKIELSLARNLFYKILAETTKIDIADDSMLLETLTELSMIRDKYNKIKNALDEVEATGYGIVMPSIEELTLEEPQIVRQGGRYGVRLKASAPSIHIESPKQMHNIFKAKFAQKHGFKGELQHYADSLKAAC